MTVPNGSPWNLMKWPVEMAVRLKRSLYDDAIDQ